MVPIKIKKAVKGHVTIVLDLLKFKIVYGFPASP